MIHYINHDRLRKEINQTLGNCLKDNDWSTARFLKIVGSQEPVDVMPMNFIKRYAEEQKKENQHIIHALIGAWEIEKEKRNE